MQVEFDRGKPGIAEQKKRGSKRLKIGAAVLALGLGTISTSIIKDADSESLKAVRNVGIGTAAFGGAIVLDGVGTIGIAKATEISQKRLDKRHKQ